MSCTWYDAGRRGGRAGGDAISNIRTTRQARGRQNRKARQGKATRPDVYRVRYRERRDVRSACFHYKNVTHSNRVSSCSHRPLMMHPHPSFSFSSLPAVSRHGHHEWRCTANRDCDIVRDRGSRVKLVRRYSVAWSRRGLVLADETRSYASTITLAGYAATTSKHWLTIISTGCITNVSRTDAFASDRHLTFRSSSTPARVPTIARPVVSEKWKRTNCEALLASSSMNVSSCSAIFLIN